ncbi:hypothetical protein CHY_0350 [Carboxydothermus hydrogenoformans Z-2901]|uniref:Uncharacterized protein n=1 Tax=Carboxydothermus hydrogenoformans (strain ATCC BAA-161 / DSM 6008 / Z-2901) TaxID=246194 RepID=Q3AF71_CARHZ|nr:hypothetical protein CHY_0350 [Carboxydothermus hydrogenoformans Z-2901]
MVLNFGKIACQDLPFESSRRQNKGKHTVYNDGT